MLFHFRGIATSPQFQRLELVKLVDNYYETQPTIHEFPRGLRNIQSEFIHYKGREHMNVSVNYGIDLYYIATESEMAGPEKEMLWYIVIAYKYLTVPTNENLKT